MKPIKACKMGFHMICCMASFDNVLIVALSAKCLTVDL